MKITKEQVNEAMRLTDEVVCSEGAAAIIASGILIANAILEVDQTASTAAQKIVNYFP